MNGEQPNQTSEPVIDPSQEASPDEQATAQSPEVIDREVAIIPLFPGRGPFGDSDWSVKI